MYFVYFMYFRYAVEVVFWLEICDVAFLIIGKWIVALWKEVVGLLHDAVFYSCWNITIEACVLQLILHKILTVICIHNLQLV